MATHYPANRLGSSEAFSGYLPQLQDPGGGALGRRSDKDIHSALSYAGAEPEVNESYRISSN